MIFLTFYKKKEKSRSIFILGYFIQTEFFFCIFLWCHYFSLDGNRKKIDGPIDQDPTSTIVHCYTERGFPNNTSRGSVETKDVGRVF